MFRKANHAFRPNHHHRHGPGGPQDQDHQQRDYHNACTVRLVRSTSMLVIGEKSAAAAAAAAASSLKRSQSSASVASEAAAALCYYYHRQEDQIWLCSRDRNCLEYLEELVALRRRYHVDTNGGGGERGVKAPASRTKKKAAPPPPPPKDAPRPRVQPSAPPFPNEEDTLRYFDAVIASCDAERPRRPRADDDGHADVDFIVASSSSAHDLHSNWVMRVPRAPEGSRETAPPASATAAKKKSKSSGSTSSRTRLQRNPIHLPKVVESALQTLRFRPKLKKASAELKSDRC
ncbi:hypothetical protein N1851_025282 [Merluccius polli]|uniref:Uncharacterized protein n=1 Tax=Merluccius polli TaxID=89951 RepID=A0AA47NW89_MERPO|nr:hypothetical protein N1851_025282 [Merluccius polli]